MFIFNKIYKVQRFFYITSKYLVKSSLIDTVLTYIIIEI